MRPMGKGDMHGRSAAHGEATRVGGVQRGKATRACGRPTRERRRAWAVGVGQTASVVWPTLGQQWRLDRERE